MPNTEPVSCGALAITPEEQKQERVREERLQQECETESQSDRKRSQAEPTKKSSDNKSIRFAVCHADKTLSAENRDNQPPGCNQCASHDHRNAGHLPESDSRDELGTQKKEHDVNA